MEGDMSVACSFSSVIIKLGKVPPGTNGRSPLISLISHKKVEVQDFCREGEGSIVRCSGKKKKKNYEGSETTPHIN